MSVKTKTVVLALFLSVFLIFPTALLANTYTSILAFGDSLSDNGVYGQYADSLSYTSSSDMYGIHRKSNGPVWVEQLAGTYLHVPLLDLAYDGATTGWDDPGEYAATNNPVYLSTGGLLWQVNLYLNTLSGPISSNTLVTVWAGANDFYNNTPYATAADNIYDALKSLAKAGFQNFLVPNLPDIGKTPQYNGTAAASNATLWCQDFNLDLADEIAILAAKYPGDHFYTLDAYDLVNNMIANPGMYGFENVTDEWVNRPAGDTGTYLFWDDKHPTTEADSILAYYAAVAVGAPVPVPATVLLLGLV